MNGDGLSQRTVLLLTVGFLVVAVAFRNPELGAAIGVGAVVIALLHQLMGE